MTAVCAVAGCGRPVRSRGWCATHYRRWQRHGDAFPQVPITARSAGSAGYWSVRRRLTVENGPASVHRCADCPAVAVCWSYDGTDPDEQTDPGRGARYSLDLGRYRPRCRFCHRRAVRDARAVLPAGRRAVPGLEVQRAVRLYLAGASCRGIGSLMGVSADAVARALRSHSVPLRPSGRPRTRP